jgi:site-specific DNA recombinase
MNPPSKAVILARVSSKSQEDEGYSLDSQVKLLQSYCENKGLRVSQTFKIAESASKSSQRRIFKEAMKFIEDNKIKHLVIEKVDRHVRNLHDAVETHDWLVADEERHVHFVKDSLILHKNSRSQEWLNWGIRVVMAKNYIDNLREEAMKGWAEKLAQGWLPAPPPPGYVTVAENGKRIHVPEPVVSKLMLKAFRFYLKPGGSLESTLRYMESIGIVSRRGKPYSKSHLQTILTNTFYIGINHFDGKDYPGAQETFIPKELFDQVQDKMHGKRPRTVRKHNPSLKGIIRCEDCGSVVTWQLQKGHFYGVCRRLTDACKLSKMLRHDSIEKTIMGELRRLICPSSEVIDWVTNKMRDQYKDRIEERERLTSTIHSQLKRIGTMDEMLYDDKLAGEINKERYDEKHRQLVAQKAELENRLSNVDATISDRLEQRVVILELSQKAADLYATKAPEKKRLIISKLFENITIKGGVVSVKYSKFAMAIADKVQKTRNIMEAQK